MRTLVVSCLVALSLIATGVPAAAQGAVAHGTHAPPVLTPADYDLNRRLHQRNWIMPGAEIGFALTASLVLAGGFGYLGGMIDNAVLGSCLQVGNGCFPVLGFAIGAVIGQTVGAPLGAIMGGHIGRRHGSVPGAFVGSLTGMVGTVSLLALSRNIQTSGALVLVLVGTILPSLGAMLGYEAVRDREAERAELVTPRRPRAMVLPSIGVAVDAGGNRVGTLELAVIGF